ncbi:iron complex outermembrane receptor protein [Sphingomonas jinjuensis]|uniref:Iron complex outermembrane receptor protein n=1 Tax=Sphingomonas jinjuensis TaxID=535907 RepID=A0A840FQY4_9SPHN|nr:TonB-dependent receptor [Sphingomonas jinjuensis]MBB4155675.1 iron complex outermembrane receptor protein [Sphingomonas jinjuensis]
MMRKKVIAAFVCSTSAIGALPAAAQQTVPARTAAQPGNAAAPAEAQAEAGDIVVTANKREELLKDVPISLAVVSGDQLTRQNVNEVAELTRSAPALNTAGPFGALSIRGIGSISFSRSSEGSVGVVVDNVALAGTSTNPPLLFDVARVEVLEGPQGTLFGRNSSAGVLNIVTNAPDPSRTEVIAHADVGSRNTYVGRGVVNLPIADNAALRVAGSYAQAPETQFNRFDGSWQRQRNYATRARFLWEPTSDITINLIGDYSDYDKGGGAPWSVFVATPGSRLSQRLAACGIVVGAENQQGCVDGGNRGWTESYGFSNQVDMRIGDHTLTLISAYRAVEGEVPAYDVDSVPIYRLNQTGPSDTHNFSQEVRLTSRSGGTLEYVGGLYYFDSEFDGSVQQLGPVATDAGIPFTLGQRLMTHAQTTSVAAFGQATLRLAPAVRLILGARYGNETVSARTDAALAPGAVAPVGSLAPVRGRVSDDYFSYRGGVQFDVSRDVMIYGTYTRGYKGPSVNDQAAGPTIPVLVRPEIPKSGEVGIKASAFGGRMTASLAGFYTKVDDFQAQFFDPVAAAFVFGNAPSLTTKGVSFNLFGRPTRGLSLNLGAVYNDARYGDGYLVACAQQQTAAQGCIPQVVNGATIGRVDDAGGNRLVGTPEWKVTASGEYAADLSSRTQAYLQADMVYTSRINWDAAFNPIAQNAPAALFGGRLGLRFADQRFGIAVFGRNLFDVYRPTVRFATPTAALQLDPRSYAQISGTDSRRVIGLSLDAKF